MTHISLKLVSSLLLAVAVLLPAAPAAAGDTGPTPAVKAEFKKTCSQRTRLVRQLAKLDNQAAEAVAAGEDPVEIHAQQTAVQDELDLVQLRLESMAIRHGLALPDIPAPGDVNAENADTESRARAMFRAGKERTNRLVARRTMRLLARLDFSSITAE